MKVIEKNKILLADCMDIMAQMPDKYVDLALVDPPYGIGEKFKGGKNGKINFNEICDKGWDSIPDKKYFQELFRISKNQIIWGGNYFNLPPTRCFICWDKIISDDFTLAMCEYAWTSFDKLAKIYKLPNRKNKIHPTQKPLALGRWCLQKYAKKGDLIFDSHSGSGTFAIAAYLEGHDFIACEKDADYHRDSVKRFEEIKMQGRLFTP